MDLKKELEGYLLENELRRLLGQLMLKQELLLQQQEQILQQLKDIQLSLQQKQQILQLMEKMQVELHFQDEKLPQLQSRYK